MENISTESVRANRALWDSTCLSYRNNMARQAGWKNVLTDLEITINEKNVSAASKKFAALKYKYNNFQNMGRSGAAGTTKDFIWSSRLDFLKDSTAPRKSKPLWSNDGMPEKSAVERNADEETDLDIQNSCNGLERNIGNSNGSGRKRKNCFLEDKIKLKRQDLEIKEKYLNSQIQNQSDPKKHFCDMLYTEIKDFDMSKF